MGYHSYFALQGRRLRHDRRRDDEAARRHAGDDEAALRRAALLRQERSWPRASSGRRRSSSRRTGSATAGRRAGPASSRRPASTRCSRARRRRPSSRAPRASTSRSGSPSCRRIVLGDVATSTRCRPACARKKNSHASAWHIDRAARRPLADERRAERAVVRHRPPRARATSTTSCRTAAPRCRSSARGRQPRLSRGGRRAGQAGQPADAVPASRSASCPQGQGAGRRRAGCCSRRSTRSCSCPWSAGTMSHFEHDLYEDELPPADWQQRWWDYVASFQGVTPPAAAPATSCATPAPRPTSTTTRPQYYDYALATPDQVPAARPHLHEDPQAGRARLRLLGQQGGRRLPARGSCRWARRATGATVIKDATGEAISPRALMAFYAPLVEDAGQAQRRAGLLAVIDPRRRARGARRWPLGRGAAPVRTPAPRAPGTAPAGPPELPPTPALPPPPPSAPARRRQARRGAGPVRRGRQLLVRPAAGGDRRARRHARRAGGAALPDRRRRRTTSA